MLSACGGGDNDTPATPAKPVFASQVSFGDSLSDVGTYKVGAVLALGGRQIHRQRCHGQELDRTDGSERPGLAAPCPAVTGLTGNATVNPGFVVPVTDFPSCTSYAMGGARHQSKRSRQPRGRFRPWAS
ncbi:hypothetical protein LP420_24620 [Massilia sp. B-10]|nr:hypothetical protein LP420_24620 [Massilia sp. B-10]